MFDPSVPHQHLGFPPASPPIAQLAHLDAFFGSSSAEEVKKNRERKRGAGVGRPGGIIN